MTFHESTVKKLRWALSGHQDHLEEAKQAVKRRRQALALAQEELGYAEDKAAVLAANVADCQRWLDFAELCDADGELAHAFANAVLNRNGQLAETRQHWTAGHDTVNCTECAQEREDAESTTAPAPGDKNRDHWDSTCRCGECRIKAEQRSDAESEAGR